MITTDCLDTNSGKFITDFPAAEIGEHCLSEQKVVWADVSDPTSEDFTEREDKESRLFGLDRIALIILVFIAFITYLISVEPPR